MSYDALIAEIQDDPLERNYEGMTDAEVAADMNLPTRSRITPISSAELLAWAGQASRFGRLEAATTDEGLSAEVRTVAKVAMRLIQRDGTSLDLSKPDREAMLDALVAAGALAADEKDELYAMATQSISRARELRLPESWVTEGRVHTARLKIAT
jgi:hypothetical protein